ncbi:MAG: hypothetical protein AMJ81_10700 [Phycisphaerae bacterium SM23_33]|nr:MAG: hypothetical protein AMJ81_10700 [Phycisphaerae bacterium SM23_33]
MRNSPEHLPEEPTDLPDVHMNRRTKICLWVIVLGLANFLAYSVAYFSLPGEAIHGHISREPSPGADRLHYYLLNKGGDVEVTWRVWIYSAVHSSTIPVTVAAVLLAMLTVAKDRIVSSMRSSAVRGREFITLLAMVVGATSIVWMAWFLRVIIGHLLEPLPL